MNRNWFDIAPPDAHALIVGGTRRGKSGLLQLWTRATVLRGLDGVTAIDPHGSYVRAIIEWLAHPERRLHGRDIHILDPGKAPFGLNPLWVPDTGWESCHLAANTLASIVESRFQASPEQTPRLSRLIYVASMFCARRRLTLLELVEVLSIGGNDLRLSLLSEFDNPIVRHELEELHMLADKHPARFLELVESAKNRFVRWLGDPRLRRILGQREGLNPRKMMDARSIVLADFSSLNYDDAAFVSTILSSMYFSNARYRPPTACARHRLILDEAESLLTVDIARMCDQSAKMGLVLVASIQRLGQLRARGDFLADALVTNTPIKVCFGGLEPMSARYMAETLFTGFADLAEWKAGSERPVAVGSETAIVRSRSTALHRAEHHATSETQSVALGVAHSQVQSVTEADGVSESYGTSSATMHGVMNAETNGSSLSSFDGSSTSLSYDPGTIDGLSTSLTFDPKQFGSDFLTPLPVITGAGSGTSHGSGFSTSASASSGRSSSTSTGASRATTRSHTSAVTHACGTTESEVRGTAVSRSRGTSRGTSESTGEGETFITKFEWMPSSIYSLEEQLHRLTGELMNLPRRECFVKIEDQRPFQMRTADLTPAFRTQLFKRIMLPVFVESVARRSSFTLTVEAADRAIAERHAQKVTDSPEPDFAAAAPLIHDDPDGYAKQFFKKKPHLRISPPSGRRGDNDNDL